MATLTNEGLRAALLLLGFECRWPNTAAGDLYEYNDRARGVFVSAISPSQLRKHWSVTCHRTHDQRKYMQPGWALRRVRTLLSL